MKIVEVLVTVVAIIFLILGLFVAFDFLFNESSLMVNKIFTETKSENLGSKGDFIGGVVGTMWALTSTLLFFLALLIQRKEFRLQRKEFELNRKSQIVYKQIERIDSHIENIRIKNSTLEYKSLEAIRRLIRIIDSEEKGKNEWNDIFNWLSELKSFIFSLDTMLKQSINVIEHITQDEDVKYSKKSFKDMEIIFKNNIDPLIFLIPEKIDQVRRKFITPPEPGEYKYNLQNDSYSIRLNILDKYQQMYKSNKKSYDT